METELNGSHRMALNQPYSDNNGPLHLVILSQFTKHHLIYPHNNPTSTDYQFCFRNWEIE